MLVLCKIIRYIYYLAIRLRVAPFNLYNYVTALCEMHVPNVPVRKEHFNIK